jgi:hypothetical protein
MILLLTMQPILLAITCFTITAFGLYFCYWMIVGGENVKSNYNCYDRNYYPGDLVLVHSDTITEKALTKEERTAYQILSQTKSKSQWGEIISRAMVKPSNREFRELIDTLYSEGIKVPAVMINIIGEDGWRAVVNCKNSIGV